jgi:hypothetical protein
VSFGEKKMKKGREKGENEEGKKRYVCRVNCKLKSKTNAK